METYGFSKKRSSLCFISQTIPKTDLNFYVTSDELESVIIIADDKLRYLSSDSDISEGCGAELSANLPPGSYFLLVNTYDNQVKQQCSTVGDYKLTANYEGQSIQTLGSAVSLKGGKSKARFEGQITADNGRSFASRFAPSDSLEISATIIMDPDHIGKSGFLMVVAQIGEEILVLNEERKFVNLSLISGRVLPFTSKILEQSEIVEVVSGLVPKNVMVNNIEVEFFVGYGLAEDPTEIYYHQTPLVLNISDKKN